MKIQIDIPEEQFKELLENELSDLPKEQIQQILLESIRGYLHHEDIIETKEVLSTYDGSVKQPATVTHKHNYDKLNAFLLQESNDSWGNYSHNREPSQFFREILKQCDFSGMQDIVDAMINDLKDNYQSILVAAISKRLADSLVKDYRFTDELTQIIERNIQMRNSQ